MWNKLPRINDCNSQAGDWPRAYKAGFWCILWLIFWTAGFGSKVRAQISTELVTGTENSNNQEVVSDNQVKPAIQAIATQILHRSLLESVWGKPTVCDLRQSIRMFGKTRSSFGKFVRAGQGSGRLRLSMQVPAGEQMNSLMQVSDGELLSTTVSVGQHSMRTQVDLGKVRERLPLTAQSLQDPVVAMYLAVGGQAELMRTLCQQFMWTQVTEGLLGQQKVWWLTGQIADKPPPLHAKALVDQRSFEATSPLRPNRATIAIGHTDSPMPFWMYQAEQWNEQPSGGGPQLHVVTQWDAPILLTADQLVSDMFRLDSTDNQPFQEETKLYLPPVPKEIARPGLTSPALR